MSKPDHCSDASKAGMGAGIPMPGIQSFIFIVCAFFLFQSCGPSAEEMKYKEESAAMADTISRSFPGIATDTIAGITHNFIRKADLKCQVENVLSVTRRIENLVASNGGYLSKSDLVSTVTHYNSVRVKEDSLLESTFYTVGNAMSIRVPSSQLDTVVRVITDLAVFVDYRRLSSDDVKSQLFANQLAQKRLVQYNAKLEKKVEANSAPLKQIAAAEESILEKQTQADGKRMESFDLADQVNYSTITLELYQQEQEQKKVVVAAGGVQPYEPGFVSKLGTAVSNGFDVLKACILFLVNSWGLLLILALLFFGVKKLIGYNKQVRLEE